MVDIVDLRNLVAEAEGTTDERAVQENFASGYDLPFGYGRYLQPSKPISQMTFKELADFQRRQVNATKGTFDNTNRGTSAVGRYQFIGPTLENLKNRLGYKDTDVFSPEVQDRLFDALMEEQGLQELSAGLITPEEFQEKLSSQFASIPKPGTETGTYKGQGTGVTSDRVSAVLSSMQDPSGGGDTFRPEDDTVPSDTGTVTSDQAEEEPGFLDTVGEYLGDAVDTVGEYASDAYDTASEYVGETVDTLEGVAESVGEKLRRLLGLEEDQSSSATGDNPPLPTRRPTVIDNPPLPTRRPTVIDNPPLPGRRPTVIDNPPLPQPRPENLRKAEGGSVEKEVKFGKKDDDDDVPDPPPGATPEEVADDIPAYLSTGEYVLPANVVRYIGLKNIADMHRMALAELQQMEDLGIIENVDENGYVEDDDDETEYMEPEGVVEVIVAEHHPKGLMSMGFADGGPVEAMVYVPGVGFVPQTQAATQPVKTEEESTPISKLRESGEDPQSGIAEQEEGTEKISAEEASSRAQRGLLGFSPFSGVAAAVNEVVSKDSALSAAGISRDQFGNTTFGDPQEGPLGKSVASSIADIMGNPGVSKEVKDHISTSLSNDQMSEVTDSMSDAQMSEVLDSIEAGFADQAAEESGVGVDAFGGTGENEDEAAGIRRGGYVTRNGIMAVGYSGGGEVGDPGGGPGEPPAEREPEPEVVEEEKPTDLYEGYTYVDGIGYVPTSRRMTSDKPVESASLALSSIFTPSFLQTIGLMSDPNKEV